MYIDVRLVCTTPDIPDVISKTFPSFINITVISPVGLYDCCLQCQRLIDLRLDLTSRVRVLEIYRNMFKMNGIEILVFVIYFFDFSCKMDSSFLPLLHVMVPTLGFIISSLVGIVFGYVRVCFL